MPPLTTDSLLQDILTALNKAIGAAIPAIQSRVALAIQTAILTSPEYRDLLGGMLRGELGVVDPATVVASIIQALTTSMEIRQNGLGISISLMRSDLSDILSVPGARFRSEGGHTIDWLSWLLTAGDEIIIADYQFVSGPFSSSRTGLGVMKRGGSWQVPPQHAGTPQDNWLTRALSTLEEIIPRIMYEEVERAFNAG